MELKTMNTRQNGLQWPLILGLGTLALARPVMSMVGLLDVIGQPTASITISAIISLVWLAAVVLARVHRPILTLVLAGVSYGVFAIILSAVFSPILTGQLQGPVTNPFAIISVLISNAIWGLVVGLFAWVITRVYR